MFGMVKYFSVMSLDLRPDSFCDCRHFRRAGGAWQQMKLARGGEESVTGDSQDFQPAQ
jgi:hypothetical protein